MSTYALVPIGADRITIIQGVGAPGLRYIGSAGYWPARKSGGSNVGTWNVGEDAGVNPLRMHDQDGSGYTDDNGRSRTRHKILHANSQPWGIVGTTLVSAVAAEGSNAISWLHHGDPPSARSRFYDWTAGYLADVPSAETHAGTWLVVEVTGVTWPAPRRWLDAHVFSAGTVLFEGSLVDAAAYRAGL